MIHRKQLRVLLLQCQLISERNLELVIAEQEIRKLRLGELIKVKNIVSEGFAERLIADGARTASEALAQQIGMGIELRGRRKDGSEFPIEIMLNPLESTEGIL
jgi:hypothetical protein